MEQREDVEVVDQRRNEHQNMPQLVAGVEKVTEGVGRCGRRGGRAGAAGRADAVA